MWLWDTPAGSQSFWQRSLLWAALVRLAAIISLDKLAVLTKYPAQSYQETMVSARNMKKFYLQACLSCNFELMLDLRLVTSGKLPMWRSQFHYQFVRLSVIKSGYHRIVEYSSTTDSKACIYMYPCLLQINWSNQVEFYQKRCHAFVKTDTGNL